MKPWPKYPKIYELNTWVWLNDLASRYGRSATLATVPAKEWAAIAAHGFDAVWLMGVWERSPSGIDISLSDQGLLRDFQQALPSFSAEDNVGSPYCIRRYHVDEHLGGAAGLATARAALAGLGIRLILDFVPNHVAPDHPWVTKHPEYFIQGAEEDADRDPASFIRREGTVFACGRDPYFPAWPDVLQLNSFNPDLRLAAIETVEGIAGQCDGIRCDMAMLMLNDVFGRTWGERAGSRPVVDYWRTVIPSIRGLHPQFLFIAEAYWDLEWELQQQGFDYCYDKKLYDRLEHREPVGAFLHLRAEKAYQDRMLRFIENHDEPRAAATFPGDRGRASAVAGLTLPGARLLHEGQLEGRKVRLPVFLGRRPEEQPDPALADFYTRLLQATGSDVFCNGEWRLCERHGWADNQSCLNILSWCWGSGAQRYLIIVNYSDVPSQALVRVPWDERRHRTWQLEDVLNGDRYERDGSEMRDTGLYVDLAPWQYHFLQVST